MARPTRRRRGCSAYRHPEAFARLLKLLADHSADYLIRQIEAGADAVQIFNSWAGVLDEASFEAFASSRLREIVGRCGRSIPTCRSSAFRRAPERSIADYRQKTGVTALGLDWTVPLSQAKRAASTVAPVQGNLDPLRLVAGGKALADGVDAILKALGDGPLIFNLGHGITPETPVEHVEAMMQRVRGSRPHERWPGHEQQHRPGDDAHGDRHCRCWWC